MISAHPLRLLLWLTPGLLIVSATAVRAATLNVPSQYPTVQAAIDASANGDTVLLADGTYRGDGNRDIGFGGKNITVTSQHGPLKTMIDCEGSAADNHRGFYLQGDETRAVIRGLTITHGYLAFGSANTDSGDGGGILIDGSSVAVRNCILTGNTVSQADGGGIYNTGKAKRAITLTDCLITRNTARSNGGGVDNDNTGGGTITLTHCTVSSNTAIGQQGGGINDENDNGGTITLTGCTLTGNKAHVGGGGIENRNSNGWIRLIWCTLTRNTSSGGGGVDNVNETEHNTTNGARTITLADCTFTGNTAYEGPGGGGVSNDNDKCGGTIMLTRCTFTGNTAYGQDSDAGGVSNYNSNSGGRITLTNCFITRNKASSIGGGMDNGNYAGGTILVTYCTIAGNSAARGGGGYNYTGSGSRTMPGNGGIITLSHCLITGNKASLGGGLVNENSGGGAITVIHSALTGNAALSHQGGGVSNENLNYSHGIGTITLIWDILTGNIGGEIVNQPDSVSKAIVRFTHVQGSDAKTGSRNADLSPH